MKDMEDTLPFAVGMSIVKSPTFLVNLRPSGISAVVLRRGGKLVEVTVPTLLDEAQRLDQRATYAVTTMPNPGTTMSFTWRGKKPTKRKGAKKR